MTVSSDIQLWGPGGSSLSTAASALRIMDTGDMAVVVCCMSHLDIFSKA